MPSSPTSVDFEGETMVVGLDDGRTLRVPLSQFPRLQAATPAERRKFELSRIGLHWDGLDEDISIAGLLAGRGDRSVETRKPRSRTAAARNPMPKKQDYHVVPNSKEGGWDVKREGAERSSGHHETKPPAMDQARDLAKKAGVERVEHNQKGRIVDSDSYGNDPSSIRDKKH